MTRRILAYGDSNTWGFWLPDWPAPPIQRMAFQTRWTGVAQAALGPGFEIVEDALPGRLAAGSRDLGGLAPAAYDGLAELPAALARNAPLDLVVLALGTNDLLADPTPEPGEVAERIFALARIVGAMMFPIALEGMPRPARVVVLSPPGIAAAIDRPSAHLAEAARAKLAVILRENASIRGYAFADAAQAIPVPGPDGVHFGPAENAALGALAATAIREALAA